MNVRRVKSIFIYPIKALGGISMKDARVLNEGLAYDRRMMLVDENGRFISQREHAKMCLFNCELNNDELIVKYKNDSISIDLGDKGGSTRKVSIWDSDLVAADHSECLNEWFSDHLAQKCFLVSLDNAHSRSKSFSKPPYTSKVSFADGYPFLVLSQESMDLLNSKMGLDYDINRFRANIILENFEAHEEDELEDYVIGTAKFRNIKPCARCIVTTIDQTTAQISKEPLKTLSSYRKRDNKLDFGVNAICLEEGIISVGDQVIT